ncbi:ABC transporter substrate-binding protein [Frankia sp. R82]|nr:ABC transporter substrate-binding protein [Frankia sp. R82]MCM3884419.1 ABC transporter substrate-binding protein [Frankia sp. R82]
MTAGATLLGVGGGGLLAACGSDSDGGDTSASAGSFGLLAVRLSWIKNVEFAGEYIADQRGYYKAAGFSGVNLMAGGASATPQDTDVATGKAFIGISSPDITANAITQGAPLKIVGAQYQKNPFAIMSLSKSPITTPQAMIGKKIGVQATNESVWSAFLKANKLDPSSITKVPVEFDPLPLTTGTVDGWFSFVTNEPNSLRVKGYDVTTFMLADHNYPLVSETFMVSNESIARNRDKVKAALTAEIRGWKDATADAALGARLATTVYGKDLGLDEAEQKLESADQNKLIRTEVTTKNGLFTVTDQLVEENIATLKIGGVDITAEELFDLSILAELYKEKPELV